MKYERFPKPKTIEKYYLIREKEKFHAFRDIQIFCILETTFIKNNTNVLNLRYVKSKLSEHKKIKLLLKEGLRKWIKANNLTSIYYVTQAEEKDENLNEMVMVEYLNRNGNDYLNNLFSNLKKEIILVPFPENQKIKKNSFVVPFNWVFANDNLEYKKNYENKEERKKLKLKINYEKLSNSLIEFANEIGIDEIEYNKKIKYVNFIINELNKNGINEKIYFIGSSYTRLGLKNSDIDFCIEAFKEEDIIPLLNKLGKIFETLEMKEINVFTENKTRLCSFIDIKENLCVDVSVKINGLPLNLQLFKIYEQIDNRFKTLVLIVKYWANKRYIDKGDVNERMINSYTYTLLIIFFLQIQQPPILPNFESIKDQVIEMNKREKDKKNRNNNNDDDDENNNNNNNNNNDEIIDSIIKSFSSSSKNTKSVGELLVDFLEYYGFEFNYDKDIICPRKGFPLTKKEKKWEKCLMGIEDPILIDRNKGNTLLSWCFEGIINEFKLAFVKLTEYEMDFTNDICQPLKELNFLPPIIFPPLDTEFKRKMLENYVKTLKE